MKNHLIQSLIDKNKQKKQNSNENYELKLYGKYMIKRNAESIFHSLVEEIKDFTMPNNIKIQSLCSLKIIIEASDNCLDKYIESLLFAIYKNCNHEEERIRELILEISEILGKCISQEVLIPTILRHLNDNELKTSGVFSSCLEIFAYSLKKIKNVSYENIKICLETMKDLGIFSSENYSLDKRYKKIVTCTYEIYCNLISNLRESKQSDKTQVDLIIKSYHSELFYPLLILQSIPLLDLQYRQNVSLYMKYLADLCSLDSICDLYNAELFYTLNLFKESHKLWRKNTADRFAFDTYVKQAADFLNFDEGENWIRILEIISNCCESDKDIEMRMDMIMLIEHLISSAGKTQDSNLVYFVEFIIEQILIPASAWKANRPNYNVRKGALYCLIKLYQNNLVEIEVSVKFIKSYLVFLKSCLDDDWDFELRNISIKLVTRLLISNKTDKFMNEEDIRTLYPLMLKRLDDSQDENRKSICKSFEIFFETEAINLSGNVFEYICQSSIIHLDDNKEDIRKSVFDFLVKTLNNISYKAILNKICDEESTRFSNKDYLNKLIEIINKN